MIFRTLISIRVSSASVTVSLFAHSTDSAIFIFTLFSPGVST